MLIGQCYDGTTAMSSSKRSIAKLISDREPQPVYITAMAVLSTWLLAASSC